ncbi:hypothetical protein AHAS_Ahas18G0195600 [Arachis hypogaea]
MGKKDTVAIDEGDVYSWVDSDVRGRVSVFCNDELVKQLNEANWVRRGHDFEVRFLPCSENDRVCEKRVSSEDLLLNFLMFAMSSSSLLSTSTLLELEGDKEALEEYLGEKTFTLTTANLKAFVSKNKKKEKEGSSTKIVKEGEGGVGKLDGSFKRKRGDGSPKVVDLTATRDGSAIFTLEEISATYESQVVLHGYREGPCNSLWSSGYPFMAVADEVAQVDSDVKIIHDVGKVGVARYLQVIGARLLSIGRTSELDDILEGDQVAAIKKLKESLEERDARAEKLKTKVRGLKEKVKNVESELQKVRRDLESKVEEAEKANAQIPELQEEVLSAFTLGFDRAIAQIGVLSPSFDVSKLDVTKIVSNGQLLDDEALSDKGDGSASVGKVD